jgi:hypothetical protein
MTGEQLLLLVEPGLLVRLERDAQLAGLLEVAVDRVVLEVGLEAVVVLVAEALQGVELVREARGAVGDAVRDRGDREAAVTAARAEARGLGLEQDDVARRVLALGVQRRPQAGEAAADDAQLGVGVGLEYRARRSDRAVALEPVRPPLGLRVGGAMGLARRG